MRPDYTHGTHAPLDHFAYLGWRAVLRLCGENERLPSDMIPHDDDATDAERVAAAGAVNRGLDADALGWLRKTKAEPMVRRDGITLAWEGGRKPINWPDRTPTLKTWAGRQSLRDLWRDRVKALKGCPIDGLWTWRNECGGASGLDHTSIDAIDVGFSPDAIGMPVAWRPAVELLAIIGLCHVALTVHPRVWMSYRAGGRRWYFRRLTRASSKYYGRLSMSTRTRVEAA